MTWPSYSKEEKKKERERERKKKRENLPNIGLSRLGRPKSKIKRKQKSEKYQDLARELKKQQTMKHKGDEGNQL